MQDAKITIPQTWVTIFIEFHLRISEAHGHHYVLKKKIS
jgi:hypothetical protein